MVFNFLASAKSIRCTLIVGSWGKIIMYSRSIINACSLLSHEWWVPLINGTHHSCERREHAFMVLREYLIIFPWRDIPYWSCKLEYLRRAWDRLVKYFGFGFRSMFLCIKWDMGPIYIHFRAHVVYVLCLMHKNTKYNPKSNTLVCINYF